MSNLTLLDLSEAKQKVIEARTQLNVESAEGWAEIFTGMRTASGQIVTRATALRCSAVLACIRILTEDISSLPLILKKKSPKGAAEAVKHPLYRALKTSPNPLQTSQELREHLMVDMLTTGKFFAWAQKPDGKTSVIYPLDASSMSFQGTLNNGELVWNSGDPTYKKTSFTNQELWRGTILNTSLIDGRSLVMLSREAIGLAIAAQEQGARLFSNGVQTDFSLEFPEGATLEGDELTQLKAELAQRNGGSANSWLPLILQGGVTAKRIGLTAEESQYMEARSYQLADIARIFRVPGVLLGLGDKTSTYASAEQFFQAYVKHTILPWVIRFEQSGERDLLLPTESDYTITHSLNALLRADQKTRFETYKTGIEGGFMQPAQARAEEGWDEIDGLDYNLTPANFNRVKDGKVMDAPKADPAQDPGQNTQNQPKLPEKGQKADKMANSIAASILRSEAREFARMARKTDVSEGQAASFAAWHVDKVMELTGASGPEARSYSDWRFSNRDSEAEARQRLVNLCLEGEL